MVAVAHRPLSTLYSLSQYELVGNEDHHDTEDNVGAMTLLDREATEAGATASIPWSSSVGCSACGVLSFDHAEDQRSHMKCDWHRYNVKMRVAGKPGVPEDEFNAMVDGDDVASISGSDSDYDGRLSEEDDDDDVYPGVRDGVDGGKVSKDGALAPYCIFRVRGKSGVGEERTIGFYRCLAFPDSRNRLKLTGDAYRVVEQLMNAPQRWAVVMLQGGHFAGAVYDVARPSDRALDSPTKSLGELIELCLKEVQHKSFHRYVVRAKAGGKQSEKDATGKFAKSAGSRLRRYNEAVLKQEILETLSDWKPVLDGCSCIFISCPGSNRLVMLGDESPLKTADARVRRIPFAVRRPTISETKRVVKNLLTVYAFCNDEGGDGEALRKKEEAAAAKELLRVEKLEQQKLAEERRQALKADLQRQEEINKAKNREKKQRQKERRKLKSQQEQQARAAQSEGDEAEDGGLDLDAQLANLAVAIGEKSKKEKKVQPPKPSQSKARSLKPDDVAARREKMAAAAEARAKALAAASSSQKFY